MEKKCVCENDFLSYSKYHNYHYDLKAGDKIWFVDFPFFKERQIKVIENGRIWLFNENDYLTEEDIFYSKNDAITKIQRMLEEMKD